METTATAVRSAMDDDVEEILLTHEQIQSRVAELGAQLAADYADREPVLVSVLKGSIIFLADLVRAMPVHVSIDLMELSSYGASTESSGQVRILKDLSGPIRGRDVIVVEDIIDTGLTLNYLLKYLHDRGPSSVRICCLLDKPARRLAEIDIELPRLHHPGPLRHRLRPGLRRALPQPAVHRRAAAIGLRRVAA